MTVSSPNSYIIMNGNVPYDKVDTASSANKTDPALNEEGGEVDDLRNSRNSWRGNSVFL